MCKNGYGYSLTDRDVILARSRFVNRPHKNPGYQCKLVYDRIWELLCKNVSMAEIARRAGIHESWMSVLYQEHFSDFFGRTTAEERAAKIRTQQVLERRMQAAQQIPDLPWIQAVQRAAVRHGLTVEADLRVGGKIPATKRVCVSKVRCAGHPITCTFEHGNGTCAEIRFSRKTHQDVDFHLAPLLIPDVRESVLVIPTADLVKIFDENPKLMYTRLTFRLDHLRGRGTGRARLDVTQYVDRWHPIRLAA